MKVGQFYQYSLLSWGTYTMMVQSVDEDGAGLIVVAAPSEMPMFAVGEVLTGIKNLGEHTRLKRPKFKVTGESVTNDNIPPGTFVQIQMREGPLTCMILSNDGFRRRLVVVSNPDTSETCFYPVGRVVFETGMTKYQLTSTPKWKEKK